MKKVFRITTVENRADGQSGRKKKINNYITFRTFLVPNALLDYCRKDGTEKEAFN